MKVHEQNGWFHASELIRAALAIFNARATLNFMDAGMWQCKYIGIRVDQRTGSFILQDGDGNKLTEEQVYEMWPSLRAPGAFDQPLTVHDYGMRGVSSEEHTIIGGDTPVNKD